MGNINKEDVYMEDYTSRTSWACFILSTHDKTEVFAKKGGEVKKLYAINKSHSDFIEMLPSILDHFDDIESSMKKYYNYALDESYQIEKAQGQIAKISHFLLKMHPFFSSDVLRFNYIVGKLLTYCRRMTDDRFIRHLYKDNDFNRIISLKNECSYTKGSAEKYINDQWLTFIRKEQTFSQHLLSPIYMAYKETLILSGENIPNQCRILWENHMSQKLCSDPCIYLCTDNLKRIKELANSHSVLGQLKELSTSISEYIYVTEEISKMYPQITAEQMYAIFLTNNHALKEILDGCYMFPQYASFYELCRYTIKKYHIEESHNEKHVYSTIVSDEDDYCILATDNLYGSLKEQIELTPNDKESLINKINCYYPAKIADFLNYELIKIRNFEQLIAFEFLNILKDNWTIRKCHAPGCENYFKIEDKRIRYCKEHKGSSSTYQENIKIQQLKTNPNDLYRNYYNVFKKRISRGKCQESKFEDWKLAAKDLMEKYSSTGNCQIDSYKKELNDLSKRCGIEPPRHYSK